MHGTGRMLKIQGKSRVSLHLSQQCGELWVPRSSSRQKMTTWVSLISKSLWPCRGQLPTRSQCSSLLWGGRSQRWCSWDCQQTAFVPADTRIKVLPHVAMQLATGMGPDLPWFDLQFSNLRLSTSDTHWEETILQFWTWIFSLALNASHDTLLECWPAAVSHHS